MPPDWLGKIGLAWFFRLVLEPGRLWRRYIVEDTQILALVKKQKNNQL